MVELLLSVEVPNSGLVPIQISVIYGEDGNVVACDWRYAEDIPPPELELLWDNEIAEVDEGYSYDEDTDPDDPDWRPHPVDTETEDEDSDY